MDSINSLIEKLPFSRSFLIVSIVLAVFAYELFQPDSDGQGVSAYGEQGAQQRIARVKQSIANLDIPDKGLLRCIRNAAEDRANIHPGSTGGIDDVRELQMLYCRSHDIKVLTGIAQMVSLRFLDLGNNHIESIAPLQDNHALQTLYVWDNPLENMAEVKSLVSLKELNLPDLPDMPCLEIAGLVEGKKSNFGSIRCAGPRTSEVQDSITPTLWNEGDDEDSTSSTELTDAQQRELLEYEREMR